MSKKLNRWWFKLLLTTSVIPITIFSRQNSHALKSMNFVESDKCLNEFNNKKNVTNLNIKNGKDYKLFEEKIRNMPLEEIANLLYIDLYKEKEVIAFITATIKWKYQIYDLERNTGDHLNDIYYVVKNINRIMKEDPDGVKKMLKNVENLPEIIKNINLNFDAKELDIIEKVIYERKKDENYWEEDKVEEIRRLVRECAAQIGLALGDYFGSSN